MKTLLESHENAVHKFSVSWVTMCKQIV